MSAAARPRFSVGDKVIAKVDFLRDWADPEESTEDHPENVDVWAGRRGTVVEVAEYGEMRVRWSHRRWIDGWIQPQYVRAAKVTP